MNRIFLFGKLWLLLLAAFGIASCTELFDIELDSTYKRLVVYGSITTDSLHHQVQLSTSSDYFSNLPSPKLSQVSVELEYNDQLTRLNESDTIPGLYFVPQAFRGVPLTTYILHVSQVDIDEDGIEETYQAISTMPATPQLDSIVPLYFLSPFVSGYQILMYANDPTSRDWYNFKLLKNQELLTSRISDYFVQTDDFFNGTYISGLPVGFVTDNDPEDAALPGDTITFELNGIEQNYYNFIVDAQLEIAGNNPLFSGPSANVRSNITNGAKGIFAAYSIGRASVVLPSP